MPNGRGMPVEVGEVKRKVVRSSPLLQTAARRRVVSGVGRTLSPWARIHILAWQMRSSISREI